MWTITDSIECPICVQKIPLRNINEYHGNSDFYQFQCPNVECRITKFSKCRICPLAKFLNLAKASKTRRLNQPILQHVSSTVHKRELAIHEHNNNINLGVSHILFEDNAMDNISDFSFVDAHDVPGSDSNELSSIGGGCENSPISTSSNDVMDLLHGSRPDGPYAISTNEDYLKEIYDSHPPLSNEITDLFDGHQKSYFDACVQHDGHKYITNLAMTRLPNSYHSVEKPTTLYISLYVAVTEAVYRNKFKATTNFSHPPFPCLP
jgi:hypothetical protein